MTVENLFAVLGQFCDPPFYRVIFMNVQEWDYRFNSLLSFMYSRVVRLGFHECWTMDFVHGLQSSSLMSTQDYIEELYLGGDKQSISMIQLFSFLDGAARMPTLKHLKLDVGLDYRYIGQMSADISSRLAQMSMLEDLVVVGNTFESLLDTVLAADVMTSAVTKARIQRLSWRSTCTGRRSPSFNMSYATLQDMVCHPHSLLKEIHLRKINIMPNNRGNWRSSNQVHTLDLDSAFAYSDARLSQDVLALFPRLVYCRMDDSRIKYFAPFQHYLEGVHGGTLRELSLVRNLFDMKEFEDVTKEMVKWRGLERLNLRGNPFVRQLQEKQCDWHMEKLCESSLVDFVFDDYEWEEAWNGDLKRVTGILCTRQVKGLVEISQGKSKHDMIGVKLWPSIFDKVGNMGLWSSEKNIPKDKEYEPFCNAGKYLGSIMSTLEVNQLSVVHCLLKDYFVDAYVCWEEDRPKENKNVHVGVAIHQQLSLQGVGLGPAAVIPGAETRPNVIERCIHDQSPVAKRIDFDTCLEHPSKKQKK